MLPGPQTRGQGGPLQFPRQPSDRSTPHAPGGSWAPAPGSLVPSVAFAHPTRTRLLLGPARAGVFVTTLQASRDVADWPVARPHQGRRCSASTAGSRPPPGAALPGTLASPRTGLTPAGCHPSLSTSCETVSVLKLVSPRGRDRSRRDDVGDAERWCRRPVRGASRRRAE